MKPRARSWGRVLVILSGVLIVAPAIMLAAGILLPAAIVWLLFLAAFSSLAGGAALAAANRTRQLRLLASLMQALREGDFSSRVQSERGPMGEVFREFNALAAKLAGEERHGVETDALLSQLLGSLDLTVLILDGQQRLVDLNLAAEELFGKNADELLGRSATDLGLSDWVERPVPFIDRRDFPAGEGPWEVRRVAFRRKGRPHRLLVVTDVSHALREEERRAWRRLIRVLSHEINNSLASIQSTAGRLRERTAEDNPPFREGLELIEQRSRALGGFIRRYAELARLPPPSPEPTDVGEIIRRVASLETRLEVDTSGITSAAAHLDPAQMEQALINLIRNAADAALETGGGVRVLVKQHAHNILVHVEDDGPGIGPAENLFVPFFTTKPGGSGIGLVLARQIIEAHGGTLRLSNTNGQPGTTVVVRLPTRS